MTPEHETLRHLDKQIANGSLGMIELDAAIEIKTALAGGLRRR